jgi:ribosome modulation factor
MPHSFNYVWRYGVQCHGVDGRPGESCFWQSVTARPVSVQEWLRGWRCGSFSPGRRACVVSRAGLTEGQQSHSGGRGSVLLSWTPTAPGIVLQCLGWWCGSGDGRTGLMVMEETRLTGPTSRRRPGRARDRRPSPFQGFRLPLSRVWRAGRMRVGGIVSRS